MIEWVRSVASNLSMIIIIRKSWERKVIFACERSGEYRTKKKFVCTVRYSKSKKKECPFELHGVFKKGRGKEDGLWSLTVIHPFHNHEITTLVGHTLAGRLTVEQHGMVGSMSASGIKPKDVMRYLMNTDPDTLVTMNHINNAKANQRRKTRGKLSVSQYTLSFFKELDYYVDVERVSGSNVLSDIFISPPSSRHLLNLFPDVIILDTTYKTNR